MFIKKTQTELLEVILRR